MSSRNLASGQQIWSIKISRVETRPYFSSEENFMRLYVKKDP